MVMEYASAAGIFPTHNFKDGTFARVGKSTAKPCSAATRSATPPASPRRPAAATSIWSNRASTSAPSPRGPNMERADHARIEPRVDNFAAVLHANQLCDELGVDTISTGKLHRRGDRRL